MTLYKRIIGTSGDKKRENVYQLLLGDLIKTKFVTAHKVNDKSFPPFFLTPLPIGCRKWAGETLSYKRRKKKLFSVFFFL